MRKAHSLEPEGRQGKLRGHRGQGKLRDMEWLGTLGNSAGTKDIRNSGMTGTEC